MPTRLYLPAGTTTALTPAFGSQWGVTGQAVRRQCSTTKANTAMTAGLAISETSASRVNVLDRQYVSAESIPSARTISGTVSAVIRCSQSAAGADGFLQLVIRVFSSDGTTERGVLYAGGTQTTVVTTAGAQNQEMVFGTADTRVWDAIALSSVAVQANDIVVIEIGWRATNTVTTSFTSARRWGDPTATADHALTAAVTTDLVPWVEFSENIFISSPTNHAATAAFAGAGSLTANTIRVSSISAVFAGSGGFLASPVVGKIGAVAFAGEGSLAALAARQANVTATLAGAGSLTAGGALGVPAAASLAGVGSLTTAATLLIFDAAVAFTGAGTMVATAHLAITRYRRDDVTAYSGDVTITPRP